MYDSTAKAETTDRIERIKEGLLTSSWLETQPLEKARLSDRMAYHGVPGVSVAIIENAQLNCVWCAGVRDVETGEPVTTETLFQAASISKPVTAVAVLRLVQEGCLDLDEDVNRYLVSWKVPKNGSWQPRVTLRQLLSHTAGMTVHGFPGYSHDAAIPTLVQILDGVPPANTPPIRVNLVPGTQMRYSGGGTSIVQRLLMDVLGKPFPQIMRELVLDPLGMKNSTYEQPLPEGWAQFAATGYRPGLKPVATGSHIYPEMAAAGLWTTPSDLALYVTEMQRAWAGKSEKVLSSASVKEMVTPQVEDFIGIGPFLSGKGESARFGHSGGNEGFHSDLVAYIQRGQGAIVMKNSEAGWPIFVEIERAIATEYGWPDFLPEPKVPALVDASVLLSYTGRYKLNERFDFLVTQEGDNLFIQPTGQEPLPLFAEANDKFFSTVVEATVSFDMGEKGDVSGLTFQQNGKERKAERVE